MYEELIQYGPRPGFKCVTRPTGEVYELVNLSGVWPADGRPTIWRGADETWFVRKMVCGAEADLFECWARRVAPWELVAVYRRDALAYLLFSGPVETRRVRVEDDPSWGVR